MTKRDLVSITLKVLGVSIFVYGILTLPHAVMYIQVAASGSIKGGPSPMTIILLRIGAILLNLAAGMILVGCSDNIANRIVREDGGSVITVIGGNERSLFALAARVIGVVVIAKAIPDLVQLLGQTALQRSSIYLGDLGTEMIDAFLRSVWATQWSGVMQAAAALILGAYLIWGADHLSRLVYREPRAIREPDDASV